MSTHYSQNTAFFSAVALGVWLDIHQGYSFVPMAYSRNLGWFASLVTIGINLFVINSGVDSPNRLHRLLFPYEDLNRPDESTEQWFKTDRTWTHAWIFTIPACIVAWVVRSGFTSLDQFAAKLRWTGSQAMPPLPGTPEGRAPLG